MRLWFRELRAVDWGEKRWFEVWRLEILAVCYGEVRCVEGAAL